MPFAIKPKQTVLFTGDSITDCDRRGNHYPLGNGYVKHIAELIDARYPAHQVKVINTGIGGHTVRDLRGRWTDDVVNHQPDWLSIKIGINDLHRWFYNVKDASVSPEEFIEIYDELLTRTRKETKARIVLVDPFYISLENTPNTPRYEAIKRLPLYGKTVEKLARKHKTLHVRTHEAFLRALKYMPADKLCPEPVHPYSSGHMIIALEWLKAVGW